MSELNNVAEIQDIDAELQKPPWKNLFYSDILLYMFFYFWCIQFYAAFIKKNLWLNADGFR